jgi:hypothetical protein
MLALSLSAGRGGVSDSRTRRIPFTLHSGTLKERNALNHDGEHQSLPGIENQSQNNLHRHNESPQWKIRLSQAWKGLMTQDLEVDKKGNEIVR